MKILRETEKICAEEHRIFVFLLHLQKLSAFLSWKDHAWKEIQLKKYFISLIFDNPNATSKTSETYMSIKFRTKLPNVNSSVSKPEAESAATTAQGPGIGITGIFSSTHNFAYNHIPNTHSLYPTQSTKQFTVTIILQHG
jgi:hypothetical protein